MSRADDVQAVVDSVPVQYVRSDDGADGDVFVIVCAECLDSIDVCGGNASDDTFPDVYVALYN